MIFVNGLIGNCVRCYKLCLLAITGFSLTACSTFSLDLEDPRLEMVSPSFEIQHLPFYPQVEDQCGPSSLATLLGFRHIDVSPETLRGKLYIPGKKGTVTTEMVAQARRFGLLVYPLEPDLIDLIIEVEGGNPVLIMQNLGFNWMPMWHFSVVMGYDLTRQTISLRSGDQYKYDMDIALFLKTWDRANNWAIVVLPPNELPQTPNPEKLIKASIALEQIGEFKTAMQVYGAILKRWPENQTAIFGSGNTAFSLQDYLKAERFYKRYLELKPTSIVGWNNLAYSLAEQGCLIQADHAIACALSIEPNHTVVLDSQKDLSQYSTNAPDKTCEPVICL